MPTYRVRAATREDAPTIVQFNLAMALETESLKLDEATLERGVLAVFDGIGKTGGALYYVAEQDEPSPSPSVVACAMVTFEWSDWRDAPCWWLQSVYCAPEHRRRGVFGRIYREVKEAAKEAGACGLRLYAETNNAPAHDVYRRLGMKTEHYQVFEEMF